MAGRVQLATRGPQDAFFTDNPEYTYFIKNAKRHAPFATYTTDHDVTGEIEFGSTLRCVIPQNAGDLLKTVSFRIELAAILPQPDPDQFGYTESIGHAMIEYVEFFIGGTLIQRVPSDFFQIHSEHYVTQTKQKNLEMLVGKPSEELSGTSVYGEPNNGHKILTFLVPATSPRTCIVDVPFYFYNNPELAVPLCALTNQECEIVVKFRPIQQCIIETNADKSIVYETTYAEKGLVKDVKVVTELVRLDLPERIKLQSTSMDYVITQLQSDVSVIPEDQEMVRRRLEFVNPIKELFIIVQRKDLFASPFDYDHFQPLLGNRYINYEHLRYATLILDGDVVLDETTGNLIHLRAVQSGIHHSRTQLFRRFYSYSFALEPERWYPTGQRNFSLVKEQLLGLRLNVPPPLTPEEIEEGKTRIPEPERELRVYALGYNVLRIEDGTARLLFNCY